MYKDSKLRTILKTVTWRVTATFTTTLIVFLFTGQIKTAIEVGLLEMIAKLVIFYLHERGWDKIKYGKHELPAFVVWITGIPLSGKTSIADMVLEEIKKKNGRKIQRLDSHDVRAFFPETGFTREEVDNHIKRVGHLASMLEKQGIISIASFVSPYRTSREFVKSICDNYIEIYLKTSTEFARQFDQNGLFEKAEKGEISNVPGIDITYETSQKPDLIIDMEKISLDEAKNQVMAFLNEKYLEK